MNTDEFIKKSKEIFNNPNWDYSETVYVNPKTPIKIYCHALKDDGTEHGYFEQMPFSHLSGHGCSKCSRRSQKYELEEWIVAARKKNDYKFDFIIDKYENQHQRVQCVCPKHGIFERTCKQVIMGTYCPKCRAEERHLEKEKEVLKQCREIHDNKYDYPNFKFKTMNDKITIICHEKDKDGVEHGEFQIILGNHLYYQGGCPKCTKERNREARKIKLDDLIQRAKKLYGDFYDLSLIKEDNIENVESYVELICPKHGLFKKRIHAFLGGQGCPHCGLERTVEALRLGNEEWVKRFNKTHQNKYKYVISGSINYDSMIEIICPIHGVFKQKVGCHYNGQGCPKCRMSHLEREMTGFLNENHIEYEYQKKFDWLGSQSLDFYLPQYNVAIECQGSQHFENDKFYKSLDIVKERDERKRLLCLENNVELIYTMEEKYVKKYENIDNLCFSNLEEMLAEIKKREI